ncbi:hypothetical protein ACFQHO_01210 [Actinomadura yumaensis]|uniref:hypothetical protein n=1 Tax=Actinomadura yumaensis TaxID=111807 RepID=UPI0036172C51
MRADASMYALPCRYRIAASSRTGPGGRTHSPGTGPSTGWTRVPGTAGPYRASARATIQRDRAMPRPPDGITAVSGRTVHAAATAAARARRETGPDGPGGTESDGTCLL